MQVLLGANNVANESTFNFGIVPVNTTNSVTLTITNLGPGILTNNWIWCSGAFNITPNSPVGGFILPPHTSTNLTLVFSVADSCLVKMAL